MDSHISQCNAGPELPYSPTKPKDHVWTGRHFCPHCYREFTPHDLREHAAVCDCGEVSLNNETLSFEDMVDRNLIKSNKPWTMETALAQVQIAANHSDHNIKFNDAFIWLRNHAKEVDEYLASK